MKVALSLAVILIASGATLLGGLSFYAKPLIDWGNPPIGNVYRFFGGIILPSTPEFFALGAVLFGVGAGLLVKDRKSSRYGAALYRVALGCGSLAVLVALYVSGFCDGMGIMPNIRFETDGLPFR